MEAKIGIRFPSAGRFFNALSVDYVWGAPVSATSGGLTMDIGLIRKLVKVPDGTKDKQVQFMLTSGMNSSALEHSMPEQLFSTPENPVQGISAVKALQIANDQRIPIYTINQSNIGTILPQLQVDSIVKADIQNAVNAGKIVTVSKTNINFNGWIGCGYVIIDPTTGAGGYMISGGINGGEVFLYLLWASVFLLVCVVGSIGIIPLILISIVDAIITLVGSQSIKINMGMQAAFDINGKSIALGILGVLAAVTLGAGLLALSAAVGVPLAIFAVAALILYATAGLFDFILYWYGDTREYMQRGCYV